MIRRINNRLILVGAAHILPESVREVRETILKEKPEIVGVELCPSRYSALMAKELRGKPEIKPGAGLLNAALYLLQRKMAQKTGTPAGEEMLTAIRSSQEVGARVELIDRDVNVTLQRFLNRMTLQEKLKFAFGILSSFLPFGGEIELENLTEEDVVKRLVSDFKRTSKTAYEVFIRERDEHMAKRIERLINDSSGKIVCVIGAGHISGLYETFKSKSLDTGSFGNVRSGEGFGAPSRSRPATGRKGLEFGPRQLLQSRGN